MHTLVPVYHNPHNSTAKTQTITITTIRSGVSYRDMGRVETGLGLGRARALVSVWLWSEIGVLF